MEFLQIKKIYLFSENIIQLITVFVKLLINLLQEPEGGEFNPPKEENSKHLDSLENITITRTPKPPKEISNTKNLEIFNHQRWNRILQEYVTTEGKVNYKSIKNILIHFSY